MTGIAADLDSSRIPPASSSPQGATRRDQLAEQILLQLIASGIYMRVADALVNSAGNDGATNENLANEALSNTAYGIADAMARASGR